jgi:hypothetical protein
MSSDFSIDDVVYMKACEEDIYDIEELESLCYSEEQKSLRSTEFKKLIIKHAGSFFMLARHKKTNKLIGLIYSSPSGKKNNKQTFQQFIERLETSNELKTQSFCVHPDYRKSGLGTHMSNYFNTEWVFGGKGGPDTQRITKLYTYAVESLDKIMITNGFTKSHKVDFEYDGETMYEWFRLKN